MATKDPIQAILDRELGTPIAPAQKSVDTDSIISQAATAHGVPESLIHAVIKQESAGKSDAVSSAGASGMMQLMPATAKSLGVTDLKDPTQNINGGTAYLRQLHDKYGDWNLALAAYNAGPGNVDKYKGIPPFPETQKYVANITKNAGDIAPAGSSIDDILARNGVTPTTPQGSLLPPDAPMTQEQLDARPKVDASSPYNAGDVLKGLVNPLDNTGTKALAVTSGVIGRPFAGPPTALDVVKFFSPKAKELLRNPAQEALSKPFDEAEKEEPIAAGVGQLLGLAAPSFEAKAGQAVADKLGPKLLNRFLKAKPAEIAPYIAEHIGVARNLDSFVAKNESAISKNVDTLQKIMDSSDQLVSLPRHLTPADILEEAERLHKIKAIDDSNQLFEIAARAEAQGKKLQVGDLNKIKQHYQGLSYGKGGPLSSDQAKVYRNWATEARQSIEGVFGKAGRTGKDSVKLGNEIAKLNQDISSGFKTQELLKKTIERETASGGWSNLDMAATFLTGGSYAPVAITNRLSKTSPVATSVNSGASKMSKLLENLIPRAIKK